MYKKSLCLGLGFLLTSTASLFPLSLENVDWTGLAGDGIFDTAGNWDPERVPGSDPDNFLDVARFGQSGALTVGFTGDVTLFRITNVGTLSGSVAPIVTLDLGGHTVNLTSNGFNDEMSLFTNGQDGRGYVITGGGTLNAKDVGFHNMSGAVRTPTLTITGADTVLKPTFVLISGGNLYGTMTVTDGATVQLPDIAYSASMLRFEASSSVLIVEDGAKFLGRTTAGNLYTSFLASNTGQFAHVTVRSGGLFETDGISLGMRFGAGGGNATFTVTGTGSSLLVTNILVGAGMTYNYESDLTGLTRGGTGLLEILDGASATVTNVIRMLTTNSSQGKLGTLYINDGTLLTNDLYFDPEAVFKVGINSTEQLTAVTATGDATITGAVLLLELNEFFSGQKGETISLISYG